MTVAQILAIIEVGGCILGKVQELFGRSYGIVHKSTRAEIDGKMGRLVWDYVLWNEITFKEDDEYGGKIYSLGSRFSDQETEELWNKLVKEFGRQAG